MPYVKLDCKFLDSTLWFEREAREVFITALLMAMPREYEEPVPEIAVDEIKETGWAAPPGWYGFVPAAGPGISHRAGITWEKGRVALKLLASPDPESRTPDHDGRRMIRIDGGYLILNFVKYRDKDHTAADRAKRWRERKRALSNGVTSLNNAVSEPFVTQAEGIGHRAEGIGQSNKESRKSAAPPSASPRSLVVFKAPTPEEVQDYFISRGSNGVEYQRFLAFYGSNGWRVGKNPMKDWRKAAVGWLLRKEQT